MDQGSQRWTYRKRDSEGRFQDEFETNSRQILAKLVVSHAKKLGLDVPEDAEALLAAYAEEVLFNVANDMENMSDFIGFMRSHGIRLQGSDS